MDGYINFITSGAVKPENLVTRFAPAVQHEYNYSLGETDRFYIYHCISFSFLLMQTCILEYKNIYYGFSGF